MNPKIKLLADAAGAFPLYPERGADEGDQTLGFRERALERFVELVAIECIRICEEHGHSAEFSYTPARALLVKKSALGCAELIERTFGIE